MGHQAAEEILKNLTRLSSEITFVYNPDYSFLQDYQSEKVFKYKKGELISY